jgi:uncharacterized integral membrane protein (TIGR00697 family)
MNEIILIIEAIIMFSTILLTKKLFGKYGIIAWIGIASVIANIQVCKNINLFGLEATVGNVMFASIFLATDILSEYYGEKYAKIGVYLGVFSVAVYFIATQIMLMFTPNYLDVMQPAMMQIFGFAPRVCLSSLLMFALANLLDVYLFKKFKEKDKNKKLWVRNNICTMICNSLENFGLFFLIYLGTLPIQSILIMAITSSVIECLIALFDTPFLYLAKKVKDKKWE